MSALTLSPIFIKFFLQILRSPLRLTPDNLITTADSAIAALVHFLALLSAPRAGSGSAASVWDRGGGGDLHEEAEEGNEGSHSFGVEIVDMLDCRSGGIFITGSSVDVNSKASVEGGAVPDGRRSIGEEIYNPGNSRSRNHRICSTCTYLEIASSSMCWGASLPAHLVVVTGTQYNDGCENACIDYPVVDLLQMMGHARRPLKDTSGKFVILYHSPRKEYYKKFLYEAGLSS